MRKPENFDLNISNAHDNGCMLMPNGDMFSLDGLKTNLNNNVIAMGTSGSKKSRGVCIPNLLACTGSYIVSDPKGTLHKRYSGYMRENGYNIVHLDFIHPDKSDGFNPFSDIQSNDDIMKISHYLTYSGKNNQTGHIDPYWDKCGEMLLSAMIGYMIDSGYSSSRMTIKEIVKLLDLIDPRKVENGKDCEMDRVMEEMKQQYILKHNIVPWSYMQYRKFRNIPPRTLYTIISTVNSSLGALDTPDIQKMFEKPSICFEDIGVRKTAVFVEASDTDRSRDILVNTFYTQAMNALCTFADDKCENCSLPVPVRFMLDDFGTNCRIDGFENMISNIRSRNISAMIILQSESQLAKGYGSSTHTIIDNCDTLIYMGGNDINTAQSIAQRANKPLNDILNMPVGTNWVFRRGRKPVYSRTIDLDEYKTAQMLNVKTVTPEEEIWVEVEEPEFDDFWIQ